MTAMQLIAGKGLACKICVKRPPIDYKLESAERGFRVGSIGENMWSPVCRQPRFEGGDVHGDSSPPWRRPLSRWFARVTVLSEYDRGSDGCFGIPDPLWALVI